MAFLTIKIKHSNQPTTYASVRGRKFTNKTHLKKCGYDNNDTLYYCKDKYYGAFWVHIHECPFGEPHYDVCQLTKNAPSIVKSFSSKIEKITIK